MTEIAVLACCVKKGGGASQDESDFGLASSRKEISKLLSPGTSAVLSLDDANAAAAG